MEMNKELIERLLREDEEFRKAYEAHREYDRQVERMERRGYLSADETMQVSRLKKLKLAMKDRMENILSRYR